MKITADPKTIVTSGPFVVDAVQAGERVVLKRNPITGRKTSRQSASVSRFARVETVGDPNNAMARLQQGTLDIADAHPNFRLRGAKTDGGAVKAYDAGPGLGTDTSGSI